MGVTKLLKLKASREKESSMEKLPPKGILKSEALKKVF